MQPMDNFHTVLNSTIIAGLISIIIFFFFFVRGRLCRSPAVTLKQPPEAGGKWPIIGHLHLFRGSGLLPHVALAKLADRHGPIFSVRIGVHRSVVISSSEMARECYTVNDEAVSNRPRMIGTDWLSWNYSNLSFAPYGSYYREIRKIAASELLSNRRLDQLRHVRESEAKAFVKGLHDLWLARRGDRGRHVAAEMGTWIGDVSLNVSTRVVFGRENGGGDGKMRREAMREFFRLTGMYLVGDAVPWLRWLDVGGHEKAMKRTQKALEDIAEECMEEHRRRRREDQRNETERDFMDVMMNVLQSADLAGFDPDHVNKAISMNIIVSGTDTTTVTIVWALCLMLSKPNVLKNVQEELNLHVGKERLVNESDVSNLTYLQAVVKETLRLYPAAPLSGPREFTEDCTIGGYHVPKGTGLITNLWKIQTDPRVWPDPLEFKPERFTDSRNNVKGKSFDMIPFGAGRRSCPGIAYGLQVTHLVLASLLQAFDVSSDGAVDMTATFGLTNSKATSLYVLLEPRLSHSLYNYST